MFACARAYALVSSYAESYLPMQQQLIGNGLSNLTMYPAQNVFTSRPSLSIKKGLNLN